ncbi:hypothetical protein [Marinilabilia salmonicolor]|uniref:hypothetical protein n=1 Tax=Marinilabilia salmonicolor TaxID=989 RepID=UPI00029AAB60|nr:hypothetical protein [Marinilabilia salmonicolor]
MDSVTQNEIELKKWKEKTRREALETEVERLKSVNTYQTGKIKKVTIALIATLVLLVTSFIGFFVIRLSEKNDQTTVSAQKVEETLPKSPAPSDSKEINIISPASDTIKLWVQDNGVLFSVQIGAYSGQNLDEFKDNMISLHQYKSETINQFTLGLFTSYEKAIEFRETIKKIGIKDSYISAIKNGKRIKIQEALANSESLQPGQ